MKTIRVSHASQTQIEMALFKINPDADPFAIREDALELSLMSPPPQLIKWEWIEDGKYRYSYEVVWEEQAQEIVLVELR